MSLSVPIAVQVRANVFEKGDPTDKEYAKASHLARVKGSLLHSLNLWKWKTKPVLCSIGQLNFNNNESNTHPSSNEAKQGDSHAQSRFLFASTLQCLQTTAFDVQKTVRFSSTLSVSF